MKLLIFSDIHSDLAALQKLMDTDADYYFAAGDLVNFGRGLERCGEILQKRAGKVYVMPGNHESAAQISAFCQQFGLHDFHGKTLVLGRYHVAGLGYSNPTPFDTPGEFSESELAERLEYFADLKPLVLICHCPPRDTPLDQIRPGLHAGSTAVGEFLQHHPPEYFFCGHIHEAAGVHAEIGPTQAVNVGRKGYLLELNEL
jgi:Icc-related predicted phosphoesterase